MDMPIGNQPIDQLFITQLASGQGGLLLIQKQPATDQWKTLLNSMTSGKRCVIISGQETTAVPPQGIESIAAIADEGALFLALSEFGRQNHLFPQGSDSVPWLGEIAKEYHQMKPASSFTMMKNILVRTVEVLMGLSDNRELATDTVYFLYKELQLRHYFAGLLLAYMGAAVVLLDDSGLIPVNRVSNTVLYSWAPSAINVDGEALMAPVRTLKDASASIVLRAQWENNRYAVKRDLPKGLFKDYLLPLNSRAGYIAGPWPVLPAYCLSMIGTPEDLNDYYNQLYDFKQSMEGRGGFFHYYEGHIPVVNDPTFGNALRMVDENHHFQSLEDILPFLVAFQKADGLSFLKDPGIIATAMLSLESLLKNYGTFHNSSFSMMKNLCIKILSWGKRCLTQQEQVLTRVSQMETEVHPVSVLFYGEPKEHEALFMVWLCSIGIDVIQVNSKDGEPWDHIDPEGEGIFRMVLPQTYPMQPFPQKRVQSRTSTVASVASQELETLLTDETIGATKPWQFEGYKTELRTLRTTYEELQILWNQEARFREGFEVKNQTLFVPNLFAKISGVSEDIQGYWRNVGRLRKGAHYFVPKLPAVTWSVPKGDIYFAKTMIHKGKIDRERLLDSTLYRLHHLKLTVQERIVDSVETLLTSPYFREALDEEEQARCLGMWMNADPAFYNLLHGYDRPFDVPKLIVYCNDETTMTLEDAAFILLAQQMAMDVVLLVPTGYNVIERWVRETYFDTFQLETVAYHLEYQGYQEERKSFFSSLFGMKL